MSLSLPAVLRASVPQLGCRPTRRSLAAHAQGSLRRQFLLSYVNETTPAALESFASRAPPAVVGAMRQTVANMLGTLPEEFFDVTVSAAGESLSQLLYSLISTGYLFRNAQFRLELQGSVAPPTLLDAPAPAPRSLQQVHGNVLLWSEKDGSRAKPVAAYITELEGEVARLRESLAVLRRASDGRNELLETIRQMEPSNLAELTAHASTDVLEAMDVFVTRLMGGLEGDGLALARGSMGGPELARILYWLLVVGYSLRTLEVRFELDEQLRLPEGTP